MNASVVRVPMLTLALVLSVTLGCASKPSAESTNTGELATSSAPLSSGSVTLIVHGMSCPLCASNVDKQLLEVPGVTNALVDMGTGEVRVRFAPNARVTRKQLEVAVHRSGFTLAEVLVP